MSSKAAQRQTWVRTMQAFGKAIDPHLFRDIAVTELVDSAPNDIGIAADRLDLPWRDPLDGHLREHRHQGRLRALLALEQLGREVAIAILR